MEPFWYRDAVIYQVDPSTFCDSDADGTGDLTGITQRLEHIRGLGANCLWVLPVHRSPFRDGGYDVVDHLSVDPRFGDLADFVELVEKAQDLGMRVMLDLVVQHTSDQHPWFQEARRDRSSRYRDWYVWTDDPEHDPATREPVFPTVEDSVWTWDEEAGQFYRHMFYSHEPDLNHANPEVIEMIGSVMSFWLRMGVAGFRVDAVPHMIDRAKESPDHRDQPGGEDGTWLLRHLREVVCRRRPDAVLLGEVDVPPDGYAEYFADGDGLMLLLDFWANNHVFLSLATQDAGSLAEALAKQPAPPGRCVYANFLRNHDELDLERLDDDERARVLDRFAPEERMRIYGRGIRRRLAPMLGGDVDRIAMAHALMLSLPGVPVLLYGDEIGLGDDLDRPERLAVRTPMQWTDAGGQGFSDAPRERWAAPPVTDETYAAAARNVFDQTLAGDSLLARVGNLVRTRIGLREVGAGRCEALDVHSDTVLALRHTDDTTSVVMLTNLSGEEVRVRLPGHDEELVDVLADRTYPSPEEVGELVLGGFGYRWLRPKKHLFR